MKERVSIRPLLQKAKDELRALAASEIRLRENHDEILRRAWTLGSYLCELKENVGRGDWLIWLPANLPELGSTNSARTENASRCMRFFKDNPPKIGNSRFLKPPAEFSPDSKRKFPWDYVPVKERLLLEGNEKVTPAPHHLTFVNEFFRYNRQLLIGKIEHFDLDLFRREIEPMARRLIELCGHDRFCNLCSEEFRGKLRVF
jgi:hypothetical protein